MPSRYEPCGLNQMYSLKYGTVPVVHATGGLDDTIEEWNPEQGTGTGFKFAGYERRSSAGCNRPRPGSVPGQEGVGKLMRNGMARNYGWAKPAKEYAAIYEEVARRRR